MIGKKILLSAAFTAAVLATPAFAAPTIYFGENQSPGSTAAGAPVTARTNFLSQLSGVSTESFESYSSGATPASLSFNGSAGTITATFPSNGGQVCSTSTCGSGRFATQGSKWYDVSDAAFSMTFNTPVAAFGFYGTDIGDFNGQLTVTLLRASGNTTYTVNNTLNGNDGSLLFWGIIDTANPFTGIRFGNTAPGTDYFGFDQLTIGDVRQVNSGVPEPTTWAMMMLGFGAMGFAMRRRSAHQVRVRFA